MKDNRYKVTREDVVMMKSLRKQGMPYRLIAEKVGDISWATAQYWVNDEQRSKSKLRNAKRRHTPEEQGKKIVKDLRRRKDKWEDDPTLKLRHEIECAIREKRSKRRTVRGVPLETAREMMEREELDLLLKQINNNI